MTVIPESRRQPVFVDPIFWLLAAGTLAFYWRLLDTSGVAYDVLWIYFDEGYRLYPSLRLLHGESLFRDMLTIYPPLSYYLHLVAFEVLGVQVSSVRFVLIASQLATTTLTYALARRLMNRWFSLFAALLTVAYGIQWLNMGYSGWYVVPLLLGATIFLARWIESGENARRELFMVGALAGLAIGIKLRDGAWVAIGCALSILLIRVLRDFEPGRGRPRFFHPLYAAHLLLPVLVLLMLGSSVTVEQALLFLAPNFAASLAIVIRQTYGTREIRPRVSSLVAELAFFGAGILAVTAPWIAYFLITVGPEVLWSNVVSLPLAWKGRMDVWAINLWDETLLFVMLPLASGIALLYAGLNWRRPSAEVRIIVVLGLLNGTSIMTLHPWTDFNHWLWASAPAILLISFALSTLHRALAARAFPLHASVVVGQCALLIVFASVEIEGLSGAQARMLRNSASGDVPMEPAAAEQTQQVIDFVNRNVPEDHYILEIPSSLYCFLTGRRQAASLDYFYVVDSEIWDEDREIDIIRGHDPIYALVREDYSNWRTSFPKLSDYVDANFEPIENWDS